jgi:hypothetical protein
MRIVEILTMKNISKTLQGSGRWKDRNFECVGMDSFNERVIVKKR